MFTDAYYKLNSDNKLELHLNGKEGYMNLPDEVKKDIKKGFIWGRRRGAWVSRSKGGYIPNSMKKYKIEYRGSDDLNSFEFQQERKKKRLINKADRFEEYSKKSDKRGKDLRSEFEKFRKDWSWITQPNVNTSAGRSFTNHRQKVLDRYVRGMNEYTKSQEQKEYAEKLRQKSGEHELNNIQFLLNRIKEGKKLAKYAHDFIEKYDKQKEIIEKLDDAKKIWFHGQLNRYKLGLQKYAYYLNHYEKRQLEMKQKGEMTTDEIIKRLKTFSSLCKKYFLDRYKIKLNIVKKSFGKAETTFYFVRAASDLPDEYTGYYASKTAASLNGYEMLKEIDAYYKNKNQLKKVIEKQPIFSKGDTVKVSKKWDVALVGTTGKVVKIIKHHLNDKFIEYYYKILVGSNILHKKIYQTLPESILTKVDYEKDDFVQSVKKLDNEVKKIRKKQNKPENGDIKEIRKEINQLIARKNRLKNNREFINKNKDLIKKIMIFAKKDGVKFVSSDIIKLGLIVQPILQSYRAIVNDITRPNSQTLAPTYNNFLRWTNKPGRYDLIGVDTFKNEKPTVVARAVKRAKIFDLLGIEITIK